MLFYYKKNINIKKNKNILYWSKLFGNDLISDIYEIRKIKSNIQNSIFVCGFEVCYIPIY